MTAHGTKEEAGGKKKDYRKRGHAESPTDGVTWGGNPDQQKMTFPALFHKRMYLHKNLPVHD
jgi:hypothetical protein